MSRVIRSFSIRTMLEALNMSPVEFDVRNMFVRLLVFFALVISPHSPKSVYGAEPTKSTWLNYLSVEVSDIQLLLDALKASPDMRQQAIDLFNSELRYTLIGAKPASFYEEGASVDSRLISILSNVFSLSRALTFKVISSGHGQKEICLIHEKSFLQCVREHKLLREFIEKNFLSAENFLSLFQQSPLGLFDFCKRDPVIIGTILGFGIKNAMAWSRWVELGTYLTPVAD